VGATGIVGRGYLEFMATRDVELVALSRRAPAAQPNMIHVPVDLSSDDGLTAVKDELRGVTDLVYAAVADDSANVVDGWGTQGHVDINQAMLRRTLDAVEASGGRLRHVLLLQGTKAYGTTMGSFSLPARESDPRPPVSSFYWAQEDLLRSRQVGKQWTWTVMRPTGVIGVAVGSKINFLGSVAAYAVTMKELGLPLHFPGTNSSQMWQMVDNHLLGEAIEWALTRGVDTNEIFNVSNGDATNWESLWPVVARFFEMPMGWSRPIGLRPVMEGLDDVWTQIATRHQLVEKSLEALASWQSLEMHMNRDHNAYVSTVKIRRYGFGSCRDSIEMLEEKLGLMVQERLIPSYGGALVP
jgi:nucleoside-diphosphate-sugar epimerase